ncbi:sensor domain-containing diguanylate cyclase [uncultured Oxalicibacterium sp.]|uniref:sensor domain-containing diguanylate cyclase n=1 Tax=uncultured Oxalicibacterium sp. TaxID=1168540 RepID=UPI0025E5A5EE|nr:sensor domain-containing diguanylate cyclase [uncultured Oxalicibacterium sp.]
MAIVLIAHDYQRAREHLLFNLLTTARTMISVVDRDLASIESSLNALSTSPYLEQRDFRAFHAQARDVLLSQAGGDDMHISLLDNKGIPVLNTRRPYGTAFSQSNIAAGYHSIRETGKPFISDIFTSQFSGLPIITIGVPIKDRYTLHAAIKPDRFYKLLQSQRLPAEWVAAIFDGQNTIIARSRDMPRFVGKKASQSMEEQLSSGEPIFVTTSHDQVKLYTVVGRSTVSSWSLAIGIPEDLINQELRQTMLWLIIATIILLASSLGAAWLIGGRIAESIRGLTGPALALGAGNVVTVPPLNLREADEVGNSLVKVSYMLLHAQYRANHDALTGLANRSLFNEVLEQHLTLCKRNQTPLSILYIDLDGFKAINDQHGHDVGDRLLCTVASRMKVGSRRSDMVARLGGDEFAIIMVGASRADSAVVAQKLVDSLSCPYEIDGMKLRISASIGIAGYPESGETVESLLQRADDAMYRAKELGRQRVETDDIES